MTKPKHTDQLRNHWWWRPGWQVGSRGYYWHLTWEGQPELHRLVDEYQAALAPVAGLDPIPQPWLHMTMQTIGFAEDVTDDQLSELIDLGRAAMSDAGPIKVRFDRVEVWDEALVLQPTPAEPVSELRAALRRVTAEVLGEAPGRDSFRPHVSIVYVNTDQPAEAAIAAVESIHPDPADVVINMASLIEQHRDNGMYEWRTVTHLPLS